MRALKPKDIRLEDVKEIFDSGDLIASNFNLNTKIFDIFK